MPKSSGDGCDITQLPHRIITGEVAGHQRGALSGSTYSVYSCMLRISMCYY